MEATAAAKADAGLAMVAAVATTAAAMDVKAPPPPLGLSAFRTAVASLPRDAFAVDPSARFLRAANCPEQQRPQAAMRPPHVQAAVMVPPPQARPVFQFPPALTAENQRAAAAGTTIDDRSTAPARRKRRREGPANGSSSDEDGGLGGRNSAAANPGARPNGAAGVPCRGRGRKNSNGSMGRDAVASLLWAAESSRDSLPVPPEARDGRGGAVGGAVGGGGGGGGSGDLGRTRSNSAVLEAAPKAPADEWVMCDHANCGKWRRVPPGVSVQDVDKW